jgi:hypothetical protein
MAKNTPKERFVDRLQEDKRRKSPTHATISKGLKDKYPIGFSKKKKEK